MAAVAVLACIAFAHGQSSVSIDESKIRAVLKEGSTTIVVPVASGADRDTSGVLTLAWVDRAERESGVLQLDVEIPPGDSTLEAPLPLASPSIWTRLRYSLSPKPVNARSFLAIRRIVALSQIADHAFELSASSVGAPRRGGEFAIHAEAVHPVSRLPITGAEWKASISIDDRELAPSRILNHDEGFVEFTFELPGNTAVDTDDGATVQVSAKLGDFEQDVSLSFEISSRLSARIQTDKPLYQPGQTLHLRAVVQDPQGRAAGGKKLRLWIEDQDGERIHTAELASSSHGIAQDDWLIPASASLGQYFIGLTTDDDEQVASHVVRVSRYELPSFGVTVTPDRTAYFPTQKATVTIQGAYLFGKPVPNGEIRVVRANDSYRRSRRTNSESSEDVVAEGTAGEDGTFTAQIDLKADHDILQESDYLRFQDIHFAAYCKDPSSGRTEQRRFDLRISREPIHVYLIHTDGAGSLPSVVYVTTSYADGQPASTDVEIDLHGQTTRLRTNRYGVGKALLVNQTESLTEYVVRATDADGLSGQWRQRSWGRNIAQYRLESDRTIYRSGQPVTIHIATPPESPPNQSVMVHAIADGRRQASLITRIENHRGQVTFPYQPEFRGTVIFVAWNASEPDADFEQRILGSRAVVFPDASDLKLSTSTEKSTYKPGEQASLRMQVSSSDGKPVVAALGLAIVDKAVFERARTDIEFGQRSWFYCAYCRNDGENEIGGVRLNDLYGLKATSAISPDLDLVAEVLVSQVSVFIQRDTSERLTNQPSFELIQSQVMKIQAALDQHRSQTLEFPRDLAAFSRILGKLWLEAQDPWGRPYSVKFGVQQSNALITLHSGGPDKLLDTADDFVAGSFQSEYFLPLKHLIGEILSRREDYPTTPEELAELLGESGLLLENLRDPWGTGYRATIRMLGASCQIEILSAGPDRAFETPDDFSLATFSGSYFKRESLEIRRAISNASSPPGTPDEFRQALTQVGIEISQYQDPWKRPYRITSAISSRYADRMDSKTVQVFGGTASTKSEVVPVIQRFITFSLRSAGPDGVEGTDDDFDVARYPVLLQEKSSALEKRRPLQASGLVPGTGAISGLVTDVTGAVIPGVSVLLIDADERTYEASTDDTGAFHYVGVPAGTYALRAAAAGFRRYEVSSVPVAVDNTTTVDIELQLGSVTESIAVESDTAVLQTQTASVSGGGPASTPRVREYFPETMLWIPELITDASGSAQTQISLADTVTTWKVAVFASTLDGRVAESESEIRAFQPFFVDMEPPQVLTEGDLIEMPVSIRNYQDRPQKVDVTMQINEWGTITGPSSKQVAVPSHRAVVVSYPISARRATDAAKQRVVAVGGRNRDAIEKSLRVRPDGQEVVQVFGEILAGNVSIDITIPQEAIQTATRGELRVYPNMASLLLESASAILATPHGCAEQTISVGYANLIALRFARAARVADERLQDTALKNVRLAVDSLGAFRKYDGGVSYWPAGEPDTAVTALALSFLAEASTVTRVDRDVLSSLVLWLEKHQQSDGMWLPRFSDQNTTKRSLLLASTVARALGVAQRIGVKVRAGVLAAPYHQIAQFVDQNDEPYMLANFVLAAMASGNEDLVGSAVDRLQVLAREERGGIYWDLQSNTPFYGWGTAGRYETTGLVISALAEWRTKHSASKEMDSLIRRGLVFLLRGRVSNGTWRSTQSTLQAMRAFADASESFGVSEGQGGSVVIRSNGQAFMAIDLPVDRGTTDPILIDLSSVLPPGENRISVEPSPGTPSALIRLTTSHWLPWEKTSPRMSPELQFNVEFDHLDARMGEAVRCSVSAKRVGFRGYGMMLAEIGLPPAAEIDRDSLEKLLESGANGLDHYEILPDRVLLYLWPTAEGVSLDFRISARMLMTANSHPSILYDYYNPEALTEIVPSRWNVK